MLRETERVTKRRKSIAFIVGYIIGPRDLFIALSIFRKERRESLWVTPTWGYYMHLSQSVP